MLNRDNFFKKLNIMIVLRENCSYFNENFIEKFNSVVFKNDIEESVNHYKKSLESQDKIDIVLSEMNLLDKKAIDILEEVKKIDEDISLIIFTKDIENEDLLSLIKLGISDFLIEPFTLNDILDSIEKISHVKYNELYKETIQKDLEDIVELVNEVSIVSKTNLNNEITFVNKSFCEASEYTEDELIGKKHNELSDVNRVIFDEIESTTNKGEVWEGKMKYLSKNSEEYFVYLTVIPLLDYKEDIKEFIWIQFLATEYEQEQKNFKKKVAQNINESRRINTQARDKINGLQERLEFYRSMDFFIDQEERRKSKFLSQIKYFEKLSDESEEKLKEVSSKAKEKIKTVVSTQHEAKEKYDISSSSFSEVSTEFQAKNNKVKELVSILDEQKKKLDRLLAKIDIREIKLGLK
ncbi:MAG: PAS domain-containing protein [Aliarcobacter sp.]|nr:PAS domain-containing protein [Aliarcobacter sp.]